MTPDPFTLYLRKPFAEALSDFRKTAEPLSEDDLLRGELIASEAMAKEAK
jgi:hypothetical protein